MPSWDYFVGFEKEPEDFDNFLDGQGYDRIPNEESNSDRNYESREGGLVELFFYDATEVKRGEVPDWKRAGYNIVSELMISTKESSAVDAALRLANETVIKYNGILYDSPSDEYFRREEL